jgi:predicted TIM-barrel fold metal-dependent hydrolase
MILWFAYLNPQNPDSLDEFERCVAAGARGVKLWISLKDEATGSLDRTRELLGALESRGLPVLIHTFHRTDDNLPGEITVAGFADLARAVPGLDLIAAHSGCDWRQALGLLAGLDNAHVDICGGYPETGQVEALVRDLGPGRVLYGSDALGRSFPSQIAKVRFAAVSPEAKARIFRDNAARLLRLTPTEISRARKKWETVPLPERLPLPDLGTDHFCFYGAPPWRDTPAPDVPTFEDLLAARQIHRAFAADGGHLYAGDVLESNRRFAAALAGAKRLAPLATLLPYAVNWRPVLEAAAAGDFAGGIAFPYLHNWRLDDPAYTAFFAACAQARLPLWINCCTADYRFRHRGAAARPVTRKEILRFLEIAPRNRYVFQGVAGPDLRACLEQKPRRDDIRFEISRLTDNTTALTDVIAACGCDRLVLGTEFPFRDPGTVPFTARRLCGWDAAPL